MSRQLRARCTISPGAQQQWSKGIGVTKMCVADGTGAIFSARPYVLRGTMGLLVANPNLNQTTYLARQH
jgi:hypothetical protein